MTGPKHIETVFPSQSLIFPEFLVLANPPSQPFLRPQIEREYWSREYDSFHSLHIITRDLFGRSLIPVHIRIQKTAELYLEFEARDTKLRFAV
jgi:hypothetical protein